MATVIQSCQLGHRILKLKECRLADVPLRLDVYKRQCEGVEIICLHFQIFSLRKREDYNITEICPLFVITRKCGEGNIWKFYVIGYV